MDQLFAYAVLGILGLMGLSAAVLVCVACGLATYALAALWMWRA
jgi:hypothetical protein